MSASAKEFVAVWQTSKSAMDVATRLQMSIASVCHRARRYKEHGVKLRDLTRKHGAEIDYRKLSAYAETFEIAERLEHAKDLKRYDLKQGNIAREQAAGGIDGE